MLVMRMQPPGVRRDPLLQEVRCDKRTALLRPKLHNFPASIRVVLRHHPGYLRRVLAQGLPELLAPTARRNEVGPVRRSALLRARR